MIYMLYELTKTYFVRLIMLFGVVRLVK